MLNGNSDERTFGERVSDSMSAFGGSWSFVFSAAFFLGLWLLINTLTFFDVLSWDKYPYILLNLVLSFLAAFQAPFIMMSQHRSEYRRDKAYKKFFNELKSLMVEDLQEAEEITVETKEIASKLEEIKQLIKKR